MKLSKLMPLVLCAALSTFAAKAKADYVLSFNNLAFTNTTGNPDWVYGAPLSPYLVGTLTAVQADFILDSQTGGVWASDFGVFITNQNDINLTANGGVGVYQAGGFNSWGSAQYSAWGTGNDGAAGTPVQATLNLVNPVTFTGTGADPNIMLAHLWNSNSTGTWSGTITLVGLTVIPEPSSFLLLSAACVGLGFVRRRRRS